MAVRGRLQAVKARRVVVLRVRGVITVVPFPFLLFEPMKRAIVNARRAAQNGSSETFAVRSTSHAAPIVIAVTEPAPITQRG